MSGVPKIEFLCYDLIIARARYDASQAKMRATPATKPQNTPTFGITPLTPQLAVAEAPVAVATLPVAEAVEAAASKADNEGKVTPALEHNCSA